MSTYVPPRTFGDLLRSHKCGEGHNQCAFCKNYGFTLAGLYKYSTRHYVCGGCIQNRKDVVLPKVAKSEAFRAKMLALGGAPRVDNR